MKKNTITLLIAASLLGGLVCACSLESVPKDKPLAEDYFKTEDELSSWLDGCYTLFSGQSSVLLDADDFTAKDPCDVVAGTRLASTETWNWSQLSRINFLLENIDNCTDSLAVVRYGAEARFFRGLFYFEMARRYQNIPYYSETFSASNGEMLHKAADPMYYVMDKAIEDFRAAADGLLDVVEDVPVRVNKWVALGFLARTALYEGTFLKYSGEADWEEYLNTAVRACEDIISSGKFAVYRASNWRDDDAYRRLFTMETMSSREALLLQIFDGSILSNSIGEIYSRSKLGATRRFVNHFQTISGNGIWTRAGYATESYQTESSSRDPRLRQILLFPGCTELSDGSALTNMLTSTTGYQPIKYRYSADGAAASSCFPIMRYPEILLTYAEAKAELGTLTQEDLDNSVNLIRNRVGMPGVSLASANAQPDPLLSRYYPNADQGANKGIILEIRRERTIELCLEGHRLWDMMRWREGAQLGNRNAPLTGVYIATPGLVDFDGDGKIDFELYLNTPLQNTYPTLKLGEDVVLSEGVYGYVTAHSDTVLPEDPWSEDRDYFRPIPASEFLDPDCKLVQNYGY